MFENITERFRGIIQTVGSRKKITEKNVKDTLREVRIALLEADVAFDVVKDFLKRVEERALGEDVLKGVNPGQQFIKVVHEQLVELMGPVDANIQFAEKGLTVILMAGLQGRGKTTTCGKLALMLKKQKRKPLLVAADVQRPAAIDQLKKLGGDIDVPVYSEADTAPPKICKNALAQAQRDGQDTVILDTAGRLHIDDEMMAEVREVAKQTKPHEVLLVCDAMVGQDAVRSAAEFNEQLELSGVVLTKLDGDARGGAALSVKAVTGKPIKFIGVGEKLAGTLEAFRPEGMAERILGMGDVVSLVNRVQEHVDEKEAAELQSKLLDASFDLNDFLKQLNTMKKMGSMSEMLKLVPGLGSMVGDMEIDDREILRVEAIIQSMTAKERRRPEILNTLRRERIARGSGVQRMEVDDLLKQFSQMKKMMDGLGRSGKGVGGKIKQLAQAKKKMGDLSGMMREMMEAGPSAAAPGGGAMGTRGAPGTKGSVARPSRDSIREKRKKERKNRRKSRKHGKR